MNYKQELLAVAFKKTKAMQAKITELEIESLDTQDKIDELVLKLSKAKEGDWKKNLKGQEWYVENLIRCSKLAKKELFDECYKELLPYNSTYDELLAML